MIDQMEFIEFNFPIICRYIIGIHSFRPGFFVVVRKRKNSFWAQHKRTMCKLSYAQIVEGVMPAMPLRI